MLYFHVFMPVPCANSHKCGVLQRAEHNDGVLSDLQEISLHQQNIERIELLGRACPQLKILYLQNNLISSLRGLQQLKVNHC